ncbi:hypothetical protein [Paenibacillus kobensis]|uniref:hypothetical protein n=1 Tax=Paenibacillus kobensis TaxID=59841 RepID=UPI000FD75A44|nr:hypothetical protein [Paenibacillus kobensis]
MYKSVMKKALLLLGILSLAIPVNAALAADVTRDRYYSEYLPDNVNDPNFSVSSGTTTSSNWTDFLQYRMNCYGYATQFYRIGSLSSPYKQQPGEFRVTANAGSIKSNVVLNSPATSINNIVANMGYDASRYGYSITEYTVPANGIVEQFTGSKRLIALVTGNTDYHYYMQHSNGTWSHKPGYSPVTNLSIDDQVPLTNSNMNAKANQGIYAGGSKKFLLITKHAVTDYPHGDDARDANGKLLSTSQIPFYFADAAGEQRVTSSAMPSDRSIAGRFDFRSDYDVFYFTSPTSRYYKITSTSNVDMDAAFYIGDSSTALATDANAGNISITVWVNAGETLYTKIFNYNKTLADYTLTSQPQ